MIGDRIARAPNFEPSPATIWAELIEMILTGQAAAKPESFVYYRAAGCDRLAPRVQVDFLKVTGKIQKADTAAGRTVRQRPKQTRDIG
jgi:hypothetical protein